MAWDALAIATDAEVDRILTLEQAPPGVVFEVVSGDGVVNKFLEPYAGAVLGKIFVLVFIILFIQKRPRGLFALKGRAVES